jgi:hypothetical protein
LNNLTFYESFKKKDAKVKIHILMKNFNYSTIEKRAKDYEWQK